MSLTRSSILFLLLLMTSSFSAQTIGWTEIKDLEDSMKVQKKPVIVKLETEWCGYCKMMDAKVFGHKKVIKNIAPDYYFVKLDAEGKEPITFHGEEYKYLMYSVRSGVHQLAKKWGEENGKMNYPTTVVLNEDFSFNKRLVGYIDKTNFLYWLESSEE